MNQERIGIMQGRLTDPPNKEGLDWYPVDCWENEFSVAKELSLASIEFVIDRAMRNDNPIWSKNGRAKIKEMYKFYHMTPIASCANFVIDHSLSSKSTIFKVREVINYLAELNFRYIIVPLFGESNPESDSSFKIASSIAQLANHASKNKIKLLLESNLSGIDTKLFLDQLGNKNIGIVYDIGNAVYCEHDIALDMNVLDENIVHIHLKDKNEQGDNVVLGDGKVNFSQFFDILKMNKYTGDFTLETSRGKNAISTATANIEFIRRSFHT